MMTEMAQTNEVDGNTENTVTKSVTLDRISMDDAELEIDGQIQIAADGQMPTVDEIVDHLTECAVNGEDLDIYQIVAFLATQTDKKYKRQYYESAFKAILSMSTQLIGMAVVMEQEGYQGYQEKAEICSSFADYHDSLSKLMAFLFCWTVLVFAYGTFRTLQNKGMYRIDNVAYRNKPDCVSAGWISIGRVVNTIVLIQVLIGSFYIVYSSHGATDIVLNSVAMFFMFEMGGLFVTNEESELLAEFLAEYKHQEDFEISTPALWLNWITSKPFSYMFLLSVAVSIPGTFLVGYCHGA